MQLMDWLKHYTDYAIFGVLGLMSLVMFYNVLERFFFYNRLSLSDYHNIYALELALTKNLTPVYTVGSTAPYVGLLGTVIGILITFYDLSQAGGDIEADKIMMGLALALKATALGILVAIPSVIFYNALGHKVESKKLAWQAKYTK